MYALQGAFRTGFLIAALALSALIARPAFADDTEAILGGLAAGYLTYKALDHQDDWYDHSRPRYTQPRYIDPGDRGYLPPGIYWYPNARNYRFDKPLRQYGYSYGPRYYEPYSYGPGYHYEDLPRPSRRHLRYRSPRGHVYGLPQYDYRPW